MTTPDGCERLVAYVAQTEMDGGAWIYLTQGIDAYNRFVISATIGLWSRELDGHKRVFQKAAEVGHFIFR
jgi:hypothetical protein